MEERYWKSGSVGAGRRSRHSQRRESFCAVFYDQARRFRNWVGAVPTDCGRTCRFGHARKSRERAWIRSAPSFAHLRLNISTTPPKKNGGWNEYSRRTSEERRNLLLLLLYLRVFLGDVSFRRIHRQASSGLLVARQERHERRDFERHLLPCGKQRDRFGLHQFHVIAPGVEFQPRANRQCRDLIDLLGVKIHRRGTQRIAQGDFISESRID